MGSIYKRGKTLWLKFYQDGRAIRESSGTTSLAAARRMLRQREGDVVKGLPITIKTGRITFEEGAAALLDDYAANKRRSIEDVRRKIRLHLRPFFGNCRLGNITTADVRRFSVLRQAAGAKNGEINRELSALRRMISLALQGGSLYHRPFVPMLKEDNARQGFFEASQYEAVVAHLPSELQPVVMFAYLTGWRINSEILTLQWHAVDLTRCEVRLDSKNSKNAETRELPYADTPELVELFKRQRTVTTAFELANSRIVPHVFHRGGKPIRNFRSAWVSACKAAGCPGRIPHDLRRTAVRNLDRAGVSQSVAMLITGHKTTSVYRRYRIVTTEDLRQALGRVSTQGQDDVVSRLAQGR